MSWFSRSSHDQPGAPTMGNGNRRGGSRGSGGGRHNYGGYGNYSGGPRSGAAYQQQTQNYAQDTTQLEAQVVFVDQARTALTVAETHLDNIANGADGTVLNATASGMVACLNLMRMSALERPGDKDGLSAAKSMVQKFQRKCERKYAVLPTEDQRKINEVRDAVCGHMLSVLNGDRSVPVFEVSSTPPSGKAQRESVTRSMQEVLRGGHDVENLRSQVRGDAARYREEVENEAKNGENWEEGEEYRGRFDAGAARAVFQQDMVNVAPVKNGRVLDREARESLKKLVRRDEQVARQGSNVRVDGDGCPDLMGGGEEDAEMEDVSGCHGHNHN